MTKSNIYLIHHRQTFFNIYDKLRGWGNSPLTIKGKEDANVAGEKLQDIHFDGASCSNLSRAMETAQITLNFNSVNSIAHPAIAPYFREGFCGSYEGTNIDLAWYNAGAPHSSRNFREIVTTCSIGQAKNWLKDADPFHDAKNNEEYWQRMNKEIELIQNVNLPDNANVLWASHGNTALSLVERFGHGKYDAAEHPTNGGLTRAALTDNDMEIVEYNK